MIRDYSFRADSLPSIVNLPPFKECISKRLLHPLANVVRSYNAAVCLYETKAWVVL
jgi:hypothetical protein